MSEPLELQAGLGDEVAQDRVLNPPDLVALATVPAQFKPLEAKTKQRMRRMPDKSRAEGKGALREAVARGPKLASDFGNSSKIPPVAQLSQLADRIEQLEQIKARLSYLLVYTETLEDIALHDAMESLDAIFDSYKFYVKQNASLKGEYPKLVAFFQDISSAISVGKKAADKKKKSLKG